jgi:hypothetical protein
LLTVTNEKGQIRAINFVATKSHSQFELALVHMRESLVRYGHLQPKIFFTDMPVDRQFLENVFASLCEEVVPVEKYAHLEPFDILSAVEILPKDTIASINDALSTILDDVPQDDGYIVVGFDSEWNVELSPQGYVRNGGKTAVIQITYQNRVYVLQVSQNIH